MRLWGNCEMPAPTGPRFIENAGQIFHAVTGPHRSIGDEHEVLAFQHTQSGTSCRSGQGLELDNDLGTSPGIGLGIGRRGSSLVGSGAWPAGQAGSTDQRDDEQPDKHGRGV
jgi:hypothetical protein